jgi:hypothetical protein
MGVVYEAFDIRRNTRVALKTLPVVEASALDLFKREFRSLTGILHPNLLQLFELFAEDDTWFFTMELIQGVDFLWHVRPGIRDLSRDPAGRLPLDQTRLRSAFRQLADAVRHLHSAGKLHRDLKPSNVLVTAQGRVAVLDFGLVADLKKRTFDQQGRLQTAGTLAYMSPEQYAGQVLREASDWYAVGVMLYEALTGGLPFSRRSEMNRDPAPPREINPDAPRDLSDLCLRLLAHRAEDRAGAAEILEILGPATAAGAPAALPAGSGDRPLFVGRREQLASLREARDRATRGETVVVHLHGRSGFGKSTLLQHFLEEIAETERAVILTGRCYEQESVPYKAFDSLIDSLSHYLDSLADVDLSTVLPRDMPDLARIFPVLRPFASLASPQRAAGLEDQLDIRRRAFGAMRELLVKLAGRRPLVLALDDLQWGDSESVALCREILRPPGSPSMLVICAFREEQAYASPCIAGLREIHFEGPAFQLVDVAVGPLAAEDVRQLAETLLPSGEVEERAEFLIQQAAGSPYFARELARQSHADAGLTLDEVLWRRIRSLPQDARSLLEAVSVSAYPTRADDAYQAAGLEPGNLEAMALLRTALFIRTSGASETCDLEAYHDRIRETVVSRLDAAVRTGIHFRLAATFEASGTAGFEQIAVHYAAAGRRAKAGGYYAQAARQSMETLAFGHAADLYRRAIELNDARGPELARLKRGHADALAYAGRGGEAGHAYADAARETGGEEVFELERLSAHYFSTSGHLVEGKAGFERMLKQAQLRMPQSALESILMMLWARLRLRWRGIRFRERAAADAPVTDLRRADACWSAATGLMGVDFFAGGAFISRGLLLALRTGEPTRIARAMALEAAARHGMNSHERSGDELFSTASRLFARLDDPYAAGMTALTAGLRAFSSRYWRECVARCTEAERLFRERCPGALWEMWTARSMLLIASIGLGGLYAREMPLEQWVEDARSRGDLYALTTIGCFVAPVTELRLDRPGEALRILDESLAQWPAEGMHTQSIIGIIARLWIYLYQDEGKRAHALLSSQWPLLQRHHALRMDMHRTALLHMRARSALAAARDCSDPAPLFKLAERCVRQLVRDRTQDGVANAHAMLACLACFRGDRNTAMARFEEALDGFERLEMMTLAHYLRRAMGLLEGGEKGRQKAAASEQWLLDQHVRNPARSSAAFLPLPKVIP